MLPSFSEFKFYQSFRLPVSPADGIHFSVSGENEWGKEVDIKDARPKDISLRGLSFTTKERIKVGAVLSIFIQFKKDRLDLVGRVVRSFSGTLENDEILYGVELDEGPLMGPFLRQFVAAFSLQRLKDCLAGAILKEGGCDHSGGIEVLTLLLSLFRDMASLKIGSAF